MSTADAPDLFLCASTAESDQRLLKDLLVHLQPAVREGRLRPFSRLQVPAHALVPDTVAAALQGARQKLAAADPRSAQAQWDLAISYERLGDLLVEMQSWAEAATSHQRALVIYERLAAADPRNTTVQRAPYVSYQRLGQIAAAQGLAGEARAAYRKALAIAERLVTLRPLSATTQRDLLYALVLLAEAEDVAAAAPLLDRAEAQLRLLRERRLLGEDELAPLIRALGALREQKRRPD